MSSEEIVAECPSCGEGLTELEVFPPGKTEGVCPHCNQVFDNGKTEEDVANDVVEEEVTEVEDPPEEETEEEVNVMDLCIKDIMPHYVESIEKENTRKMYGGAMNHLIEGKYLDPDMTVSDFAEVDTTEIMYTIRKLPEKKCTKSKLEKMLRVFVQFVAHLNQYTDGQFPLVKDQTMTRILPESKKAGIKVKVNSETIVDTTEKKVEETVVKEVAETKQEVVEEAPKKTKAKTKKETKVKHEDVVEPLNLTNNGETCIGVGSNNTSLVSAISKMFHAIGDVCAEAHKLEK